MSKSIEVRNLNVDYILYNSHLEQGLDFVFGNFLSKKGIISSAKKSALKNITFSVNPGERIGIIGSNGAGKTTLLKTIIGNLSPSDGYVHKVGNILPLMTTGLGFHPELSGLENIKISLTLSGVPKNRRAEIIKDIVDFVELGDYIDQPIRTYSLGMIARLGFATSTSTKPEILIIDEVLGSGDTYFNNKCNQRVKKLSENGTTLLIVSHSMEQILAFSERVIWMNSGQIQMDGTPQEVVRSYDSFMSYKISTAMQDLNELVLNSHKIKHWSGGGELKINKFYITENSKEAYTLKPRSEIAFNVEVFSDQLKNTIPLIVIFAIFTPKGEMVAQLKSNEIHFEAGVKSLLVSTFFNLNIGPGEYLVSVSLHKYYNPSEPATLQVYDLIDRSFTFKVVDREMTPATNIIDCSWRFN